ncbi:hypothetical protein H0E87_013412, partial [Populus deltoides]
VLAEKLNLNYEEAERWIVNLIRNSKLDAKIDSQSGTVIMEPNHPNVSQINCICQLSEVSTSLQEFGHKSLSKFLYLYRRYEQLIDHTKALSGRTSKLVSQILEHAQGQSAR